MANTPACPECDQMDRVIRVSSAHSGGIATQTSRSSGVGLTLTRDGLPHHFLVEGRVASRSLNFLDDLLRCLRLFRVLRLG
jgi:hypothetical protein